MAPGIADLDKLKFQGVEKQVKAHPALVRLVALGAGLSDRKDFSRRCPMSAARQKTSIAEWVRLLRRGSLKIGAQLARQGSAGANRVSPQIARDIGLKEPCSQSRAAMLGLLTVQKIIVRHRVPSGDAALSRDITG